MSVEDTVKHCIETSSVSNDWDYTIGESEDDENTVILHGGPAFLTPELTEKLRKRLIFVDATSSSYEDDYSVMYFLHYLEPEEDTFMDSLAEPVSTNNSIEAVTREIAETEIDETSSFRYNIGFIAALNWVRQRTSENEEWTGVPLHVLPRMPDKEASKPADLPSEEELEQGDSES